MSEKICLAIESSCDETSVAITRGRKVLSNIISSQIEIHKEYGGVVPEIASRKHIENISYIIDEALKEANKTFDDIDFVATTYGPGLVGALLVGLSTAKAIAYAIEKPLVGVHHIEGHIAASYIANENLKPPFACLVVSGGHTHLVHVKDYTTFDIIGRTRDDAAGEAFDKVARAVGLPYPGGPLVDKTSKTGDPYAYEFPETFFKDSFDFSFSGLKTAVLNIVNKKKMQNEEINVPDLCASFQRAVVDVLVKNTIKFAEKYELKDIVIAGGVAANSCLRETMKKEADKKGFNVTYPDIKLCTDNAAMIGVAGFYNFENGKVNDIDLNAIPNLELGK